MDIQSGGRSLPRVQIQVGSGRSNQDVADLTRKIDLLAKSFEKLQQTSGASTKAVTEALTKQVTASTHAVGSAQRQARATRAPLSQTDQEYTDLVARRRTAQRQQALVNAYAPALPPRAPKAPPTEQEQQYRDIVARDRAKQMEETIKRGTTRDTGMLARGMNALSWMPGVPPSLYMALMAGGETGLGLSAGLLASGLGLGVVGAGALGLQSAMVGQQKTGEQLAAAVGAAPGFVSSAQDTAILQAKEYSAGLKGGQGQEIAGALAAGGMSRTDALGAGFDRVTNLVNAFGMSIQQATDFVTTERTDLGYSDQQLIEQQRDLALTAAATNVPLANLGRVLSSVTNLPANLPVAAQGPTSAMLLAAGGNVANANDLGNIINARGAGGTVLGSILGHTPAQLQALQSTTAGQQQLVQEVLAKAQQAMTNAGGDRNVAQQVFNAEFAQTGVQVGAEEFQRLASNAPAQAIAQQAADQQKASAAIEDQQQALALLGGPAFAPGGEDQYLPVVAAGGVVQPPHAATDVPGRGAQIIGTTAGNLLTPDPTRQVSPTTQTAAATAIGGPAAGVVSDAVRLAGFIQDQGGVGNAASTTVQHVLNATFTLVNQAGGVLGIKQITIPLPNGDQAQSAYVRRAESYGPTGR